MKKAILFTVTVFALLFTVQAAVHAQRYEKHDKKRSEYYRERGKKSAGYYRESSKRHRKYVKEYRKHKLPPWARAHRYDARHHVYFRDYRTFYDPYRGGYVYLNGGDWHFSAEIPSFMINVNLGLANITVVKAIPISRHPEDFYGDYGSDNDDDWDDDDWDDDDWDGDDWDNDD